VRFVYIDIYMEGSSCPTHPVIDPVTEKKRPRSRTKAFDSQKKEADGLLTMDNESLEMLDWWMINMYNKKGFK
jgi:hypothetical protein